jgi:2-polyprenyl-3-methyl-5-hydroxy-6-metoxy-1,4-benzoquinol methylase
MLDRYAGWIEARYKASHQRVLEIGAGTGALAQRLKERGFVVDGVELSSRARDEARRRFGLEFRPQVSDFADDAYDLVVALETIEHFCDPWRTLEQWSEVVRPSGHVFVTTPNLHGLAARVRGSEWCEALKDCHLVLFGSRGLASAFKQSGFTDVRFAQFGPITSTRSDQMLFHRGLQAAGLYGGLRAVASKPRG